MSVDLRSGSIDAHSVTVAAVGKLREIDARILDLQRTREAIDTLLSRQCVDPSAACPIVAALTAQEADLQPESSKN